MKKIGYNFTPRPWQQDCLEKMKRFSVLAVHRRAGKTTLAINGVLIVKAIQKVGLYAYIAPELKQAKRIAWKTLKDTCSQFLQVNAGDSKVDLCSFRESELIVRFWNGSEIMLVGADNPDSLRGIKLGGVVIDEVAQMPKELWHEIVYPALMDSKGFALFIGTPKGINLFSDLFYRGQDPMFKDEWISKKYTCYETDALSAADIDNYKQSVPEEVFKREMLCDFSASGNNQLISVFEAEQASHKTIDEDFLGRSPLLMGVDVARFGADSSMICFRKGLLAYAPIEVHGADLVTLTDIIIRHIREKKPKAVFIDGTGLGGGVVDMLNHSLGLFDERTLIFDINFGHKSIYPNYTNKRSEMWGRMADWIKRSGVIPRDDDLVSELAMPVYDVNDKGQMSLESKKQIRDRLGKSPDKADALALTFAEDFDAGQNSHDLTDVFFKPRLNVKRDPFSRFESDFNQCQRKEFL